jgi:hypothetical protein
VANRFTDQFVALMRLTLPQRRLAWRRGRGLQWLGLALAWFWLGLMLYLLRPVAFSPVFEPYRFLPPNLGTTAFDVLIVILLPLVTMTFTALALPSLSWWLGAGIVRTAALSGRTTLTVGAIDQPKPLAGDEIPQDAQPFTALKLPTVDKFTHALVISDIVFTLLCVSAALFLWPRGVSTTGGLSRDSLDLFLFTIPFFGIGKFFVLYGAPQIIANGWWIFLPGRRQRLLAVDGWGIRWRETRWRTREQTLAWQDIAAFCIQRDFTFTRLSLGYNSTYLLLGNDVSFSWVVPARANDAQRAASELLARLVVTYTQKPLLDVTASLDAARAPELPFGLSAKFAADGREPAKTLLAELQAARRSAQRARPEVDGAPSDLAGYLGNLAGDLMRPLRLKARYYWINAALLALVAVGICGMWMIDQQRSDVYIRTLSPRVAAETPLVSDSLTSDNHAWPVQAPTTADPTSLAFAHGGYAINGGPDQDNYTVWRGARYADLAVAVTLREIAAHDYDVAGLVAQVQGAGTGDADKIIFDISPLGGSWELFHYQPGQGPPDDGWHYLGTGDSAAIHTGAGATNRLLLVIVGTTYLCYVNGQFVGGGVDSYASASSPHSGYAGLFVRAPSTVDVFNDFAIYPAPPPYQPLLHGLGL